MFMFKCLQCRNFSLFFFFFSLPVLSNVAVATLIYICDNSSKSLQGKHAIRLCFSRICITRLTERKLRLSLLTESKNPRREHGNHEKPWQIHPKKPKKSKSDLAVSSLSPPSPESKSCKLFNFLHFFFCVCDLVHCTHL